MCILDSPGTAWKTEATSWTQTEDDEGDGNNDDDD